MFEIGDFVKNKVYGVGRVEKICNGLCTVDFGGYLREVLLTFIEKANDTDDLSRMKYVELQFSMDEYTIGRFLEICKDMGSSPTEMVEHYINNEVSRSDFNMQSNFCFDDGEN